MNITYKEIGIIIERSEANIKYMKKNNPNQLEIIKMGCLCKKYNIDVNDLISLNKMKEKLKEDIKL